MGFRRELLEVVRECADLRRWKHLALRLGGVADLRGGGVLGGIKILGDEVGEGGGGEECGKGDVFQRVTVTEGWCWRWCVDVQTSGKYGSKCWRWYVNVQTSGVGIV